MYQCHRVVWSEGLLLSPHHFQQWDLFAESQLAERTALLRPFAWGVYSMQLDTEALARGELHLVRFRGLMPNGHAIRIPEFDPPPPISSFTNIYDAREAELDVYLALPAWRHGGRNQARSGDGEGGGEEARFSIASVTVADETSGRNEQPIEHAVQNLKLLFGKQARHNYDALRIAQITQTSTGDYRLVDAYVPPLLAIDASPSLVKTLKDLQEKISARSSELAKSAGDPREMTPSRYRYSLHLQAVNQLIPVLAHALEHRTQHPEAVYVPLAALAGQLMAISDPTEHHPRSVPAYRHEALGPTFSRLSELVQRLLDLLTPSADFHVISLSAAADPGRFDATIPSDGLVAPHAALFLAVSCEDLSESEVVTELKRTVVASRDRIFELVARQIPGVGRRQTTPPPVIRARPGTVYFQLISEGPEWEAIRSSKALSIQLPARLKDQCKLELLGIEGNA